MVGRISINCRRGDDPGHTQALRQILEQEYPAGALLTEVEDQIRPGDDFVAVLKRRVAACDVLLVVIGPRWADLLAQHAGADNDFVAIEIEAALGQGKRVIPVLVGGAAMPRAAALPPPLRALATRHAVGLRPERFEADCEGLVAALKEHVAVAEEKPASLSARLAGENEAQKRETGGAAAELVRWRAIEGGRDVQALRRHLVRFPDGA